MGIDVIALFIVLLNLHWCYCAIFVCFYGIDVVSQLFLTSNAQMLRCRGILFNFLSWGGKQNFVPNMWQVVFAHISIESRVVDSKCIVPLFQWS